MPKVGGRRKKARSQKQEEPGNEQYTPKAFVFKCGKCTETCKDLSLDFRKCFYPHTAMKLQDSNKLAIKSYLKAGKYYGVTHLVAFQQSKQKTFARFIKIGGGQMQFRVINYCRMKDVFQKTGQSFNFSLNEPLIVLNNFTQNNQIRQIGRSIQQMFPNINLDKINMKTIKRVLSFTYQANKKCIYFRHYRIVINEGGMKASFKQLTKQIHGDLSQYKSFAEYLDIVKNGGQSSNTANANANGGEIEEEGPRTQENQREVKLVQIGPRMKLKFVSFKENFGKVQDDENDDQNQDIKKGNQRPNGKSNNRKNQDKQQQNGQQSEQQNQASNENLSQPEQQMN